MQSDSRGDTLKRITKAALGGLAGCALVLGGTQAATSAVEYFPYPEEELVDLPAPGPFDGASATMRLKVSGTGTNFKLEVNDMTKYRRRASRARASSAGRTTTMRWSSAERLSRSQGKCRARLSRKSVPKPRFGSASCLTHTAMPLMTPLFHLCRLIRTARCPSWFTSFPQIRIPSSALLAEQASGKRASRCLSPASSQLDKLQLRQIQPQPQHPVLPGGKAPGSDRSHQVMPSCPLARSRQPAADRFGFGLPESR
jgi:hypothetical protein